MKRFTYFIIILIPLSGFHMDLLAAPASAVLIARAETFRTMGLLALAREQYLYVKKEYPKEKRVDQALNELSRVEFSVYLNNAIEARKAGALALAAKECQRALAMSPNDSKAKGLSQEVANEIAMKKSLVGRVSKEYLAGLELYQAGRYDQALDSFVKTLNMDPDHQGALHYVQKIGEKLGKVENQ